MASILIIKDADFTENSVETVVIPKNYLSNLKVKTETLNGVTLTVEENSIIKITGTPTAQTSFVIYPKTTTLLPGKYYLHERNNKAIAYGIGIQANANDDSSIVPSHQLSTKNNKVAFTVSVDKKVGYFLVVLTQNISFDISMQFSIETTDANTDWIPVEEL